MAEWRCLTVRQPWAWAMTEGKTIENRSFRTSYRGRIAIHAGRAWADSGRTDARVRSVYSRRFGSGTLWPGDAPFVYGAVIATAWLDDCHEDSGCCRPWGESSYRDDKDVVVRFVHHWALSRVRRLYIPIPASGRQGLWKPDDDLAHEILRVQGGSMAPSADMSVGRDHIHYAAESFCNECGR